MSAENRKMVMLSLPRWTSPLQHLGPVTLTLPQLSLC